MPSLLPNFLSASVYVAAIAGFYAAYSKLDIFSLCWNLHFVRRIVECFLASYTRKGLQSGDTQFHIFALLGGWFYYGGIGGFLIGKTTPGVMHSMWGIIVFLVGEVGNAFHHRILAQQKSRRTELNSAGFFYLTKPHYFFEIVSWIGFALAFPSVTTGLWVGAGATAMVFQVLKKKKVLHKKQKYAIIPWVF
jgi:protein-S-isoprenylcysteine O-methyltransferase Ste14